MIVYSITNKINNKIYFCATIYDDLKKAKWYHRSKPKTYKRRHKLNPGKRLSMSPFHKAYLKYGERNFRYKIEGRFDNEDELYKFKEYLIFKHNTMNPILGYNCTTGGNETFKNSPETKKRQSIAFTGKIMPESFVKIMKERVGELHPCFGYKHTKEAIENMRQGQLNSNYVQSDDSKKRKSETMKRRWQEPEVIAKMAKRKLRDISGKNNPLYGVSRKGKDNPMYGKRAWNRGIPMTEEQKKKLQEGREKYQAKKRKEMLEIYSQRTEKICYKCKDIKSLDMFYKSNSHLDGYAGLCKLCEKKKYDNR